MTWKINQSPFLMFVAILLFVVSTPGVAKGRDETRPENAAARQLCSKMATFKRNNSIRNYYLPAEQLETPHELSYTNLDMDGDGITDKVTIGSGSGESLLRIVFSSGGILEENAGLMVLLRYENVIYVLVTSRHHPRSGPIAEQSWLYLPTKRGFTPICELLPNQ